MARLARTWEEFFSTYGPPTFPGVPSAPVPSIPAPFYGRGTTARELATRGVPVEREIAPLMRPSRGARFVGGMQRAAMYEPRQMGRLIGLGGRAPSEAIAGTAWAKRHRRASAALGLLSDVLISPTTYITGGAGGFLKAAGRAGAKAGAEVIARTALREGAVALIPRLGKEAGLLEFTALARRVGEVAGREGFVSKRLVEGWIRPFAQSAEEERLLMAVARHSARVGEQAAKGGVRFGVPFVERAQATLIPRAPIRQAAEWAGEHLPPFNLPGVKQTLGRFMQPGYISATKLLSPAQKEMTTEAILAAKRLKRGGAEQVVERLSAHYGQLTQPERESLPYLLELPRAGAIEDLPGFRQRLLDSLEDAISRVREAEGRLGEPLPKEEMKVWAQRVKIAGAEATHYQELLGRFGPLTEERRALVETAGRATRLWTKELWKERAYPQLTEQFTRAAAAGTNESAERILGLVPRPGVQAEAAVVGGKMAARRLLRIEARLKQLVEYGGKPNIGAGRWTARTTRAGFPGFSRSDVMAALGKVQAAKEAIGAKAVAGELSPTAQRVLQTIQDFGRKLTGGPERAVEPYELLPPETGVRPPVRAAEAIARPQVAVKALRSPEEVLQELLPDLRIKEGNVGARPDWQKLGTELRLSSYLRAELPESVSVHWITRGGSLQLAAFPRGDYVISIPEAMPALRALVGLFHEIGHIKLGHGGPLAPLVPRGVETLIEGRAAEAYALRALRRLGVRISTQEYSKQIGRLKRPRPGEEVSITRQYEWPSEQIRARPPLRAAEEVAKAVPPIPTIPGTVARDLGVPPPSLVDPKTATLEWLRKGPGALGDRVKQLVEHVMERAKPGFVESYVPHRPAKVGRWPVRTLGAAVMPFEMRRTVPTIAEREAMAAVTLGRAKATEARAGEVFEALGRGEEVAPVRPGRPPLPIDVALERLEVRKTGYLRRAEILTPGRDISELMGERAFTQTSQDATRALTQRLKETIGVPLSRAAKFGPDFTSFEDLEEFRNLLKEAPKEVQPFVEIARKELRGYKFPVTVARDVVRHFNHMFTSPPQTPALWNAWSTLWRWMVTAGRPAWWMPTGTNIQGNIYNAVVLAEMRPDQVPSNMITGGKLLSIMKTGAGKFFDNAKTVLGEGGNPSRFASETIRVAKERMSLGQLAREARSVGVMEAFGRTEVPRAAEVPLLRRLPMGAKQIAALGNTFAIYAEQLFKAALFVDKRRAGLSVEDAGAIVQKFMFSYPEITAGEARLRAWGVPFYVWIKNNVGIQFQSFVTKPGRPLGVARARAVMGQNNLGLDPRLVPDWIEESGAIPVFSTPEKQKYLVHYLPLYDVTRLMDLRQMVSTLYPVWQVPFELIMRKEIWSGRPFREGDYAPFPVPGAKAIPADIRAAAGIVMGEWPVGTGRKQWIWPARRQYLLGRFLPYMAYAGRFAEAAVPEEELRRRQALYLGLSLATVKPSRQVERYEARREAALAAVARKYRALDILPPTATQKKRAEEFLEETE